ncbi:carbohydrate ABC transporter permease [Sinomonas halotolerans]|uniref:Carbohydrate ABC transporter permease n=1 Tax=Sinomonas halotolerans TaxID=1644133 RepID=A0ABU9X2G2_9MICC
MSARPSARQLLPLAILIPGALIMLFPFVWMVLSSLKTVQETTQLPQPFFPGSPEFGNYVEAWLKPAGTFGHYYLNSVLLAVGGTAVRVALSILAAYAFAMMRFPGKRILFALFLLTAMVPGEVTLIPNFITIRHLPLLGGNDLWGTGGHGLYNSFAGMILPTAVDAFSVFLLRQAFLAIPGDYWEAASLDGCSRWGFLTRIALPMISPAVGVVAVLSAFEYWNSLLWPLVVTDSDAIRPVQVGILALQGEFDQNPNLVMAAAALSVLPVIALYLIVQRQFRESVTFSGLRG